MGSASSVAVATQRGTMHLVCVLQQREPPRHINGKTAPLASPPQQPLHAEPKADLAPCASNTLLESELAPLMSTAMQLSADSSSDDDCGDAEAIQAAFNALNDPVLSALGQWRFFTEMCCPTEAQACLDVVLASMAPRHIGAVQGAAIQLRSHALIARCAQLGGAAPRRTVSIPALAKQACSCPGSRKAAFLGRCLALERRRTAKTELQTQALRKAYQAREEALLRRIADLEHRERRAQRARKRERVRARVACQLLADNCLAFRRYERELEQAVALLKQRLLGSGAAEAS